MKPLIVDAHEDLAWNMLTFGRDYTLPVEETRRREKGSYIVEKNGDTTISWQEYQKGQIALVFATLFAAPARVKVGDWDTEVYANTEEAYKIYSHHLDAYNRLFDQHPDKFTPVHNTRQLEAVLGKWNQAESAAPTGLVTLMEGADGIRSIGELDEWWERGVRIIGPAWMSTRYCGGTREPGPLTKDGRALLESMAPIGFSLDLSHMAWESALEALDLYDGMIIASHANALKQIQNGTSNRFLTDEIIEGIIQRDGVIGVVPFNRFLIQDWKSSDPRSACPLELVVAQIDYICQKAGNTRHVGFGTDFDGGFGLQQIPAELDTIADLHLVAPLLTVRGYSQNDIAAIFGGNWIEILRDSARMNEQNIPNEANHNIAGDRVRFGLFTSITGLVIFIVGAKPEWFGLSLTPVVGFVQITVLLIGLALLCLGGYVGLAALWGGQEKSIAADIGSRLISTGYVISVFSGLADVFGMSPRDNAKIPFFGPWQAAGMEIGIIIIAIGILLFTPYKHLKK